MKNTRDLGGGFHEFASADPPRGLQNFLPQKRADFRAHKSGRFAAKEKIPDQAAKPANFLEDRRVPPRVLKPRSRLKGGHSHQKHGDSRYSSDSKQLIRDHP